MKTAFLFVGLLLFAVASIAQTTLDASQEARFVKIASGLRCLVCQNQSIADSHAELALDLRQQIREQIAAGRSDADITAYMVERYGDFVLYRPPFKRTTWLLWLAPALLLLAGVWALRRHLGARRVIVETPLSVEEQARAAVLLQGEQGQ